MLCDTACRIDLIRGESLIRMISTGGKRGLGIVGTVLFVTVLVYLVGELRSHG